MCMQVCVCTGVVGVSTIHQMAVRTAGNVTSWGVGMSLHEQQYIRMTGNVCSGRLGGLKMLHFLSTELEGVGNLSYNYNFHTSHMESHVTP